MNLIATKMHVVDAFLEFLKQLLPTLGGTAAAIAALAWLARSIVKQWLSKDVETYKNTLKAEADVALERLRSELQITADRRNIEYSRIHENRLNIISEIAEKIRAFNTAVAAYTSAFEVAGGPSKEERRKVAFHALAEFDKYFGPRRFFLPKKTVKKIEAFRSGLQKISVEFMVHVEQGRREVPRDPDKNIEVWIKANEYTETQAPMLIEELEDDFRNLLGGE
jgi:hypothetical protein